ncbi:MAG: TraR/DksA C4-type zinc finger protein [Bacteroidetes bacterium]|nr:TraR/DksA C4-type zinc finger protein [Bacteroidota bacterium]
MSAGKQEHPELSAEEDGKPKRKYTRRSKKTPVPVPKYQGKQGSLLRKKGEMAVPLAPREQVSYPASELEYFKEIILQKIHDANEELLSIEERLNDSSSGEFSEDSTYSLHMADQGTDAMEREKAYLFAARERKFISHLTDALQRIKSGNYGICIVCGNLIEKGRLEAVPHARMCVNCKQETKVR